MFQRVLVVALVALLAAAAAAYALRPQRGVPQGAPTLDEMADAVGADVMEHIYRGHVPDRSAEIFLVPKPHRYLVGEWPLTTLQSPDPYVSTSHPNPWDYLARVPIVFYGPGFVDAQGVEDDEAIDIASIAPTYACLLGMSGFEAAVEPLARVCQAGEARRPKAIFSVVVDGGGWNALQEHPRSWPNLASLMDGGITYTNATIGSAPSITGALHATFGTGFYPKEHGIPGNQMRGLDGRNVDAWLQKADPRHLDKPTVSELWDEQNDNRPVVGTVSYEGWHLGMIGHGAMRPGGDKDVAVLWEVEDNAWWINQDFYRLPSYLQTTELDRLERYERALDGRDGIADATWFGHTLEELQEAKIRPGTPAFVRFTGDAVMEVLQRERVGEDDVTDLFWVEMKMPDFAGHAWNMLGPEQADVIQATDAQLGRFKRWLDRAVGRDDYLLMVSADHGQQPLPEMVGGWRINSKELERDLQERFADVIEKISPVDIYVDMEALREQDASLTEIARYVAAYTIEDNIPDGAPGAARVPEARLDERLFAGAFPTDYIQSLAGDVARFGESQYPEGDLTSARRGEG